jgi:hypothetical protein
MRRKLSANVPAKATRKTPSASVAEAIGASAVRAPPTAAEVNKPHIKKLSASAGTFPGVFYWMI